MTIIDQSPANCHCIAARQASRRISLYYDACLAPAGLRATQFSILAAIAGIPALTVQSLADMLHLDRSTAGQNLRPLVRDGLVETAQSDSDRRARALRLTASGTKKLAAALPRWQRAQAGFEAANGPVTGQLRGALAALSIPD